MRSIQVNPPVLPRKTGYRFSMSTLGCKVNSFESELIAQKLEHQTYQRVGESDIADLYIINTCTVTAEADRQARQQVRKVVRRNPEAWVVVTGCYAQIDPEACAQIPGVDLVLGNGKKLEIPALLDSLYQGQLPPVMVGDLDHEMSLPNELLSGYEGKTRAFLQIQQGCDQGCTFCIIHTARGPNRSFSVELIRRQFERLIMNGYKEIVICGVDIGSYGTDFQEEGDNLARLLKTLTDLEGDFRIRLSSIDPAHISDELIELMANTPSICPQFHLSMQSGNTLILKRMKRRATRELLYERIHALRAAIPDMVLSADIIVGFPTETKEQFEETLLAIQELSIPYPHVFPYSQRSGTPAARIPRQVPVPERKRRAKLAREKGDDVWRQTAQSKVGQLQRILVEGVSRKSDSAQLRLKGRCADYFPVELSGSEDMIGEWVDIRISDLQDSVLLGEHEDRII